MKKNGFIATSILYTFFLVFITLFVALITNYIHNQVLLAAIDEASIEQLNKINNTKLSDLKVGDRVKIRTAKNNESTGLLKDGNWIVAYIVEEVASQKYTYYLLADTDVQSSSFIFTKQGLKNPRKYSISIDVYNELKTRGFYTNSIEYNIGKSTNKQIEISMPTVSILGSIRNSGNSEIINNAIYNAGDDYLVYNDVAGLVYEQNTYYNFRKYNFDVNNYGQTTSSGQTFYKEYCNASYDGKKVTYDANNKFGYMHIQTEAQEDASGVKNEYIDYCIYSSPVNYHHNPSDLVVNYDEGITNDKATNTYSASYNIRLMGKITVDVNDESTYLAGGKGIVTDPYLLADGSRN